MFVAFYKNMHENLCWAVPSSLFTFAWCEWDLKKDRAVKVWRDMIIEFEFIFPLISMHTELVT